MTQLIRKFYDAPPADGGGNPLPPSLAELSDPNYKPAVTELDAAQQAAKAEADKIAADEKVAAEAYEALVKEAKNEDGTLKEGYEEKDGKIVKIEAPASEEEVDDDIV